MRNLPQQCLKLTHENCYFPPSALTGLPSLMKKVAHFPPQFCLCCPGKRIQNHMCIPWELCLHSPSLFVSATATATQECKWVPGREDLCPVPQLTCLDNGGHRSKQAMESPPSRPPSPCTPKTSSLHPPVIGHCHCMNKQAGKEFLSFV